MINDSRAASNGLKMLNEFSTQFFLIRDSCEQRRPTPMISCTFLCYIYTLKLLKVFSNNFWKENTGMTSFLIFSRMIELPLNSCGLN